MKYHVCQFSGKTNNSDFFDPNLSKNWFWGQNFKNLSADSRSGPPRDHVCQFSVKMDNFELFDLNLGKLLNYMQYVGSANVTLRVLQRAGWRLKLAGWRWVHGLVISIFLIWRKNDILFSTYLDFCAFVKSTEFKSVTSS